VTKATSAEASRLPIKAVILDMDGLLIDTEPIWRLAEKAVFGELGVDLSEAELVSTTGQVINDVLARWRRREPRQDGRERPSDAQVVERVTVR
jgi:beta-phosphoglucomutase-like phosphatase (HAD superfamily)